MSISDVAFVVSAVSGVNVEFEKVTDEESGSGIYGVVNVAVGATDESDAVETVDLSCV